MCHYHNYFVGVVCGKCADIFRSMHFKEKGSVLGAIPMILDDVLLCRNISKIWVLSVYLDL